MEFCDICKSLGSLLPISLNVLELGFYSCHLLNSVDIWKLWPCSCPCHWPPNCFCDDIVWFLPTSGLLSQLCLLGVSQFFIPLNQWWCWHSSASTDICRLSFGPHLSVFYLLAMMFLTDWFHSSFFSFIYLCSSHSSILVTLYAQTVFFDSVTTSPPTLCLCQL